MRFVQLLLLSCFASSVLSAQTGYVTGYMNDGVSIGYESLIELKDGSTVAGGKYFNNFINTFVLYRVDTSGTTLWSTTTAVANSTDQLSGFTLVALPDTGFMFIGYRPLFPGTSIVLLHFDKNGNQTGPAVGYEYFETVLECKSFLRSDSTILVTGRYSSNGGKVALFIFDTAGTIQQQNLIEPNLGIGESVSHLAQWGYTMDESDNLLITSSIGSPSNPPVLYPYFFIVNPQLQVTSAHVLSDSILYFKSFGIQRSQDGGIYLLGERDSMFSPTFNMAIIHCDTSGQVRFYKEYIANDNTSAMNWTLYSRIDSADHLHIMHGNATSSTTWLPGRKIHFYEIDSAGNVLSNHSRYGETPGGMYLSQGTPVCFFKANENSWSSFSIISKDDGTMLSSCQSLGAFHDHVNTLGDPVSSILPVTNSPDSALIPTLFTTSTSAFTYQQANYCLTANVPAGAQPNEAISVYPNPTNENTVLRIESVVTGEIVVQLYSVTGECIYVSNKTADYDGKTEIMLPLDNFAAGIYVCRIESNSGTTNVRIIKEK